MPRRPITDGQKIKILEAHKMRMSTRKAATYAGVENGTTVWRYWKEKGLKPHYESRQKPISKDKIDKIFKAHELKMSTRKAAEYASVYPSTVRRYWKNEGLKPNFEKASRTTQDKIDKIFEAYKMGLSTTKAAKYAGVSQRTVWEYWKQKGLESHYKSDFIPITLLLDGVFDTKNSSDQLLNFEEIKKIVEDKLRKNISRKPLEERINLLTQLGVYEKIEIDGEIKYKAGMPRAMDGLYNESI